MKNYRMWGMLAMAVAMAGCDMTSNENPNPVQVGEFTFEETDGGWTGGLAEYSKEIDSSSIEFSFRRSALPSAIDTTRHGLRIQSHNRSDDMFMFLKRKVSGLQSEQTYKVYFEIDLGTSYPESSVGIGGSPGSSVYLKAGASGTEPARVLDGSFYKFNLDKGNQSEGGKELTVLGNVANGLTEFKYKLIQRDNLTKPVEAKTDAEGNLWLCVGTDSGFEGLTVLYYDRIRVTLVPVLSN
ncbi:hypothetical protein [Dyadobacter sp. 32]|uniref:hypothetical protein n=1 Tax=Dyadobacter sp. 32 TaxID=538966 RepID=UPI0011EE7EC6